jgi:hypothetical protein
MSEIRVDDLMREVADQAAGGGPEPVFPQLELQRLQPELRQHAEVEPRPVLLGRTRYERLWVRINTLVRRVAAHAVEPAVTQQNEWNAATLAALDGLIDADATLRATIAILRAENQQQGNKS